MFWNGRNELRSGSLVEVLEYELVNRVRQGRQGY